MQKMKPKRIALKIALATFKRASVAEELDAESVALDTVFLYQTILDKLRTSIGPGGDDA